MAMLKRTQWTEDEVTALPAGEHEYFERKGGAFVASAGFREGLAKAVSAFANSGGGHLVMGVADNGTLEGIDPTHGRTTTRDWVEQVLPAVVSPELNDFRVHEVLRHAHQSAIPPDRVVIVVDIGDSMLAPHQAEPQNVYYFRQGGRSVPAPHFYLEALRARVIGPVLVPTFRGVRISRVYEHSGGVFVQTALLFRVKNEGTVAAYRWHVFPEVVKNGPDRPVLKFRFEDFPRTGNLVGGITIDETILPSLSRDYNDHPMGFAMGRHVTAADVLHELENIFTEQLTLGYRVVSEFSAGEVREMRFRDAIDLPTLADAIVSARLEP